MTTIDDECVDYARECVRLAGLTDNPELREQAAQYGPRVDGHSHARAEDAGAEIATGLGLLEYPSAAAPL
jgi:hypothetical protein